MEMFVVFNVPPFCSLDSFASHLFRVFVHLNTIKKQGLSWDLRSPSAIFCLVIHRSAKSLTSIILILEVSNKHHCKLDKILRNFCSERNL